MSEAATCNGFKIRGLNQDSNHVSVQSSHQTTWMLTRRTHGFGFAKSYEVGLARDELMIIKGQESARPEFEITPLGDKAGVMIAQSSRHAAKVLRVGVHYVFELEPGESLTLRSQDIKWPTHAGAGLTV